MKSTDDGQKFASKIMHFSCMFMHFPSIFIIFFNIFPISKIVGAPQGPEGGPESTIFEIGKNIDKNDENAWKMHENT